MAPTPKPKSIPSPPQPSNRVEWTLVTPSLAQEWLNTINDTNRNRPLSWPRIGQYTNAMRRGEWRFVGDPLRFGTQFGKDVCYDGEHRLTALVQSGTSHWFLCVYGLSVKDRDAVDQGRNRSAGDVLALAYNVINGTTVAAWTRLLHETLDATPDVAPRDGVVVITPVQDDEASCELPSDALKGANGKRLLSISDIHSIFENNKQSYDWAVGLLGGSVIAPVGSAAIFCYGINPTKAQEFFEGVHRGVGLPLDSPALIVRNHIATMKAKGRLSSGPNRTDLLRRIIRAFDYHVKGLPLKAIPKPSTPNAAWVQVWRTGTAK